MAKRKSETVITLDKNDFDQMLTEYLDGLGYCLPEPKEEMKKIINLNRDGTVNWMTISFVEDDEI